MRGLVSTVQQCTHARSRLHLLRPNQAIPGWHGNLCWRRYAPENLPEFFGLRHFSRCAMFCRDPRYLSKRRRHQNLADRVPSHDVSHPLPVRQVLQPPLCMCSVCESDVTTHLHLCRLLAAMKQLKLLTLRLRSRKNRCTLQQRLMRPNNIFTSPDLAFL